MAEKNNVLSRAMLMAASCGKFYFLDPFHAELLIFQRQKPKPEVWTLKPPKHYRPAPKRKLNDVDMFNRKRFDEWRTSFTQIWKITVVQDRYLAIEWTVHEPYKCSLDIYDLSSRELIARHENLPGRLVGYHDGGIYFFEQVESDDEALDGICRLHVFTFRLVTCQT